MKMRLTTRPILAALALAGALVLPSGGSDASPALPGALPLRPDDAVRLPEDPGCPSCTWNVADKDVTVLIARTYTGPVPLSNTTLRLYDATGALLGTYANPPRNEALYLGSGFVDHVPTAATGATSATLTWLQPGGTLHTEAIAIVR